MTDYTNKPQIEQRLFVSAVPKVMQQRGSKYILKPKNENTKY